MPATNLSARLQTFGAELRQLEKDLKDWSVDADPLVVRDFREAVDNVRLTAWTVQLWLEERAKGYDPAPLRRQLAAERVRRGTQLSTNLAEDVTAGEVTTQHPGVGELVGAVELLYQRLKQLFAQG